MATPKLTTKQVSAIRYKLKHKRYQSMRQRTLRMYIEQDRLAQIKIAKEIARHI